MEGKKVLVTGGCGFLGSNLIRRVLEGGAEVTTLTLPRESSENLRGLENKITIAETIISGNSDFRHLVKDKDYLFHFAWQTDLKKSVQEPQKDIHSDVIGLVNLLESCRQYNPEIKIFFPSTSTIAGRPKSLPVNEDAPEDLLSPYEINKSTAEKYLSFYFKKHGIRSTCLRLSNVFGEGQRIDSPNRGILNFMIGKALRGEDLTVYGDGEFVRDYCYVQNYVDAFLLAAQSKKTDGKMYVLGSGEPRTFNEVVSKIKGLAKELYGKDVKITYQPFPDDMNEVNKRNFVADSARLREDTGWVPKVSFEEGLKRTMEFYGRK